MLQLFSAIFGFAAPFLPELLKFYKAKQDNEHELAMMRLRLEQGAAEHAWRMEEINANADIAEMHSLRTPQQSFGVQLLDAARDWSNTTWGKWLIVPVFYGFSLLDFVSGMVRPVVTYAMVVFYMLVKWAQYQAAYSAIGTEAAALNFIWTDNDWAVLVLVLSYWFGQRAAKAAFGGSASTGRPGA